MYIYWIQCTQGLLLISNISVKHDVFFPQLTVHTMPLSIQDPSAMMHAGQNDPSLNTRDGTENGAACKVEAVVYSSKVVKDIFVFHFLILI